MPTSTQPTSQLLLPEWSAELTTRAGLHLYVRPAAPDDAEQLGAFFTRLTAEDLRFRFLTPLRRPDENLLHLLADVDHVGTENFLAFATRDGRKMLVASAMIVAAPDGKRAEVAIAVEPDFRSRGIGWTLLDHVALYARARGIRTLESVEFRDNSAAIELEREMGFTATAYPGDPTLVLVRKTLVGR